ncbi:hypothetical protein [Streptomyces sp. NBC_01439]|uniref:hypothetical protein n=1 Tax=Streptomyces sp. NBC_01439 TaxID=2903867 RepID=UPI002E2DDE6C|nr:hypothetical protein [Streptomyces sp. NBC_01439]
MSPDEMRARIAELTAEAAALRAFADAADRGEHDDEQRIAAAVARMLPIPEPKRGLFGGIKGKSRQEQEQERIELVRRAQRSTLSLHALNRVTKEIYPEIHELQFRLATL